MLLAMLQHPDFRTYDLSSPKKVVCAGAPVPVALLEQVKEQIGAEVCILFGQTETSAKVQKFVLREQAIRDLGLEERAKTKTA